ncbi:hypothetical protein [Williamsia deligens]|uniref:Uncharacterized protein n=1 Tax=Williamsia deligens TaxID=321325 RepID=A0ABW3G9G4_9NOCA|nr:hypothetical protein [Williamsia deligens]MCP2195677.1 hypothetical protein [Williamsia deligens]
MITVDFSETLESLPVPDGFAWLVVSDRQYDQACRDGLPTLYLEFKCDDDLQMHYLVGQALVGPEVAR